MKPHIHATSSAKRFGGKPEDYHDIHQFMDSSKAHIADHRHRAIFHNSFGCFIVESVFGITRVNSAGKVYSTRDIAEQHIIEDLGHIPTVQDYLRHMEIQPWMGERMTPEKFNELSKNTKESSGGESADKSENESVRTWIPFEEFANSEKEDENTAELKEDEDQKVCPSPAFDIDLVEKIRKIKDIIPKHRDPYSRLID
jgi:hypothetical protein